MHAKSLFALLILGCAAIIVAPNITTGQPGGGKQKGGGTKGMDASQLFDYYAKGQGYVNISDIRFGRNELTQYAQDKGINNGKLTRAQFMDFQEQLKAKILSPGGGGPGGGGPGGGGKGKKFGNPADMGGGQPVVVMPAVATNPDFINTLADEEFKRLDTNRDGKLNSDEMPPRLKFSLSKWDKNNDGLIDLLEFREYFRSSFARLAGGGGPDDPGNRNSIASIIIDEEELDRKVVVFRGGPGGKMPAGLPSWFKELDTDEDGQVCLSEWRRGGKDLDEFKLWDLNDDGLITPEEAVKYQAILTKQGGATTTTTTTRGNGSRPTPAIGNPDTGRPAFDKGNPADFMKKKKKSG